MRGFTFDFTGWERIYFTRDFTRELVAELLRDLGGLQVQSPTHANPCVMERELSLEEAITIVGTNYLILYVQMQHAHVPICKVSKLRWSNLTLQTLILMMSKMSVHNKTLIPAAIVTVRVY